MAIVTPDKTVRSNRLTSPLDQLGGKRISKTAYWAYSLFVAALRDDFARFQFSARVCLPKVAPQRPDITEREVEQLLLEYESAGLLRTWLVGETMFAEWYRGIQSGKFHSAPEPPWSEHTHAGWCWNTGIRQARLWTPDQVESLLRRRNNLREGDHEGDRTGDHAGDHAVDRTGDRLPPSSPSSPSSTRIVTNTPKSPLAVGAVQHADLRNGRQRPPAPPANAVGLARARALDVESIACAARERWCNGTPLPPETLRKIRQALKSMPPDELMEQIRNAVHVPDWMVTTKKARI